MTDTALDVKSPDVKITPTDVRKYFCPKATDKEVEMFLITCKLHGLNPFKREAYLIKYGTEPAQTVVGYESYIKRAELSGQLNGWECWIEGDKAKVKIYRKDRQFPFTWEVDRAEFDKGRAMWKVMKNHMLKKVAISQAFRLFFSEDIGGLPYTREEMDGVGEVVEYSEIPPRTPEMAPKKPPEKTSPETNPPVPEKEEKPSDEVFLRQSLLDELPMLIDASTYEKSNMKKPMEEMTTGQLEKFKAHVLTLIDPEMMEEIENGKV